MVELAYKDFRALIINIFKHLKDNIIIMNEEIGHVSKKMATIKNKNFRTESETLKNYRIGMRNRTQAQNTKNIIRK